MPKTFQYMPNQIKPSVDEVIENLDFTKLIILKKKITEAVEKNQANHTSIIKGISSQIGQCYFLRKNKEEYFLHPMLKYYNESEKNKKEILHYGLCRYSEPYLNTIEYLYNKFKKSNGFFKQKESLVKRGLINIYDNSLSQSSIENNVDRSLKWLYYCGIIKKKKSRTGGFDIIIEEYKPDPRIFYFSMIDELKKKKFPDVNESWLLKNSQTVKIWFLRKNVLSNLLYELMTLNFISFGQLTGQTINISKESIKEWNFHYGLK